MSAGAPDVRVHDDAGFKPDHVLTRGDHEGPPLVHEIAFELDPHGAIVVGGLESAVDFRALKDETAALTQRDDLLHHFGLFLWLSHGRPSPSTGPKGAEMRDGVGSDWRLRWDPHSEWVLNGAF